MEASPDRRTAGFEPPRPQLLVRAVTDSVSLGTLKLAKPDHWFDFVIAAGPAAQDVDLVAPGQVVASFSPDPDADASGYAKAAGPGTEFDAATLAVSARAAGVVLFDGTCLSVLPLALDGRVDVSISSGSDAATATLTPPGPGGKPVSAALVVHVLASSGVRLGTDQQAIDQLVQEAQATGQRVSRRVAAGREPQRGADGVIEYLVDLGGLPLSAGQNDRVDWKSLNIICSVKAHEPLLRRHPATKGTPGYTVTGRILPASDGREAPLPLGSNVKADPADPNVLIAAIDGNLRLIHGKMEVSKSFTVPGNVDYSTGHIRYDHSVVIRGDVKAGFNVECGADLEVKGAIEDSLVIAGGNVLVRGGFIGQGAGLVRAGGSVHIGFGRNQTVQASGSLVIEREAINMNLQSDESVSVAGLLVGGEVMARKRIECRMAGNPAGARTKLEVGVMCKLLQAAANLAKEIDSMRRRRRPEDEIATLEAQHKALLDQAYSVEAATIVIKERINPGVLVKVGAAPLIRFAEETRGPVVLTLHDGEVKIS